MGKSFIGILITLGLAGCRTESLGDSIKVYLYPDGHLDAYWMSITPDELPAFAKEVGRRPVLILPVTMSGKNVTFTQAVETRDKLKAGGVPSVRIAIAGE